MQPSPSFSNSSSSAVEPANPQFSQPAERSLSRRHRRGRAPVAHQHLRILVIERSAPPRKAASAARYLRVRSLPASTPSARGIFSVE